MGYNMKRGAAPKFKELGSSKAQPGDSPGKFDVSSLGAVAGGAAKGAKLGSMLGPLGGVFGGLAGGLIGAINSKKQKVAQMNEEKKNELLAQHLQKEEEDKERSNVGYSGFDASSVGTD